MGTALLMRLSQTIDVVQNVLAAEVDGQAGNPIVYHQTHEHTPYATRHRH